VRVVLDTNVLVSGIFFGGLPARVLDAWADGRLELVLSPAILDEYLRVCERIAESRPALEYESVLAAIAGHGVLVADTTWEKPITIDPDDDKFMLCARAADAVVVSGDFDLLDVSGWEGVKVLKPRELLGQLGDSAAV
jgi:putative PIN family toxin of toxin-antitoxin system